jgi:hypothetical protein
LQDPAGIRGVGDSVQEQVVGSEQHVANVRVVGGEEVFVSPQPKSAVPLEPDDGLAGGISIVNGIHVCCSSSKSQICSEGGFQSGLFDYQDSTGGVTSEDHYPNVRSTHPNQCSGSVLNESITVVFVGELVGKLAITSNGEGIDEVVISSCTNVNMSGNISPSSTSKDTVIWGISEPKVEGCRRERHQLSEPVDNVLVDLGWRTSEENVSEKALSARSQTNQSGV